MNDILDYSTIEAGEVRLDSVDFNVVELLNTHVDIVRMDAQMKGLRLNLDVTQLKYSLVRGDPVRIGQILGNLIANAVKFTQDGGVDIIVSSDTIDEHTLMLACEVKDSGLGIPPKQLNDIFMSFSQVDGSSSREQGGAGLGLAIVKNLCELMGGSVTVESAVGRGSRFLVKIPLRLAIERAHQTHEADMATPLDTPREERATEPAAVTEYAPDLRENTKRVLLVEDNPINQEVAAGLLEMLGLPCDVANNGIEALAKLASTQGLERYCLILMDCQMPEMDGYETTKRIRGGEFDKTSRDLPIIAITANAMTGDRERCLAVGMNDYISKPIDVDELHEKVRRWLDGRVQLSPLNWRGADDASAKANAASGDPPSLDAASVDATSVNVTRETSQKETQAMPFGMSSSGKSDDSASAGDGLPRQRWDQAAALKRVNGKPERIVKLIRMYINASEERMGALQEQLAAPSLSFESMRATAHALKGVTGNLGAEQLMDTFASLEKACIAEEAEGIPALVAQAQAQNKQLMTLFEAYVAEHG